MRTFVPVCPFALPSVRGNEVVVFKLHSVSMWTDHKRQQQGLGWSNQGRSPLWRGPRLIYGAGPPSLSRFRGIVFPKVHSLLYNILKINTPVNLFPLIPTSSFHTFPSFDNFDTKISSLKKTQGCSLFRPYQRPRTKYCQIEVCLK